MFGRQRPRPRTRREPGSMNKTELAYLDVLRLKQASGEIVDARFEAVKLRLAHNTFYTPDFLVVTTDALEFHEVKGFWEDDARVKIKVAAQMFPEFLFVAVKKVKGGWEYERF